MITRKRKSFRDAGWERLIVKGPHSTKQETDNEDQCIREDLVLSSAFSLMLWEVFLGAEYLYHNRIPSLLIFLPAARLKKETSGETDIDKWVGEVIKV